jgi:hypothetical protein
MNDQYRWDTTLLAIIALAAALLAWQSIKANDASGAAAWSAILMAIVNAIKEARQGRTIDRMQEGLQRSAPTPETPERTTVEGGQ